MTRKMTKIRNRECKKHPLVRVTPRVNTKALRDCLTKFMCATEKQIVRKFRQLPDAQVIQCDDHGDAIYIPGKRTNSVLLVAHYDTVWGDGQVRVAQDGFILKSTRDNTGIGADDRAGVAALWLLRNSGHALLIVPAEETGCRGSRVVAQDKRDLLALHAFAIQFDRRGGHDLVTYDCDNTDFNDFLLAAFPGYHLSPGSFSDISELCPAGGIAGVNISIGYRREHTANETLDLLDFARTLMLTRSLLERDTLARYEYVDSWATETKVWSDIERAIAIDGGVSVDSNTKVLSDWFDEGFPKDSWADKFEDTYERWCHACGTVSFCNDQLECSICGSNTTEAIA